MSKHIFFVIVLGTAAALMNCTKPAAESRIDQPSTVSEKPAAAAVAPTGQSVYDTNCATCHTLGKYDAEGEFDLAGHQGHVSQRFVERHAQVTLDKAAVANLKAFIAEH